MVGDPDADQADAGPRGARAAGPLRYRAGAALMHRVFALDVLACPRWGGRLRLIATVQDPSVGRAILAHLGVAPAPDKLWSGPAPTQPTVATA